VSSLVLKNIASVQHCWIAGSVGRQPNKWYLLGVLSVLEPGL
jgi:hypothetical protein